MPLIAANWRALLPSVSTASHPGDQILVHARHVEGKPKGWIRALGEQEPY